MSNHASTLHQRLDARGVLVLAVTVDDVDPLQLFVYLHGYAGKYNHETAFSAIRSMPEVAEVRASEQTAAILLVRLISRTGSASRSVSGS